MRGSLMTDPLDVMRGIIDNYQNNPKWQNAALGGIKLLSNSHVGSVGQDFVRDWCESLEISWQGPPGAQNPWDARIAGLTFEVKTATEDVNGSFQFNHIRHHREYQALLCLGIAPNEILFDAWRKGDVAEGLAGHLVTMDKNSSATWKLTKKRADLLPIAEFEAKISQILASFS